ncbi:pentatricopeptide repeat-containing protein [Cocos nucifera]|uniref:Pentatricopeptide repeat-containing protein n=1 Tax=Cocos nucifera TaxID=13894 RepID=A0A8K0HW14_COCNU|nr:pentatricopeptide repeat-containing protein [Cocos nucifera]
MSYALSFFHHHHSPSSPYPPLFDALIRAISENSLFSSALSHFALMVRSGLRPGRLAFPFALKSAASLPDPSVGASLHAFAAKLGVDLDPFVRTSLVDMYVKLGSPVLALQMFDDTPEWHRSTNVLLWNVLISACCQSGDLEGARRLFESMPERSIASWNSMIHGYMQKGYVEQAAKLFNQMPERNVVSWTTMVAGFSQLGENERALRTFDEMLEAGMRPNNYTIASVLSACARMGALDSGIRIHEYVLKNRFRADGAIGTALVDMYSKCGKIDRASEVFDHMEDRDILTWTAMIMGWAVHGNWKQALQCFKDMKCTCVKPDGGVFLAMLMACSHSGRVEHGLELFDSMRYDYKIEPNVKHYTCMVDLFGRAGRLDEALAFMEAMPIEPDFIVWGALFNACQSHKNVELAEVAAEKLLKLKPKHQGSYIFLANIYAGAGRWKDAEKVRITMKDRGMELSPGWSNIEVEGSTHHFVAGD